MTRAPATSRAGTRRRDFSARARPAAGLVLDGGAVVGQAPAPTAGAPVLVRDLLPRRETPVPDQGLAARQARAAADAARRLRAGAGIDDDTRA